MWITLRGKRIKNGNPRWLFSFPFVFLIYPVPMFLHWMCLAFPWTSRRSDNNSVDRCHSPRAASRWNKMASAAANRLNLTGHERRLYTKLCHYNKALTPLPNQKLTQANCSLSPTDRGKLGATETYHSFINRHRPRNNTSKRERLPVLRKPSAMQITACSSRKCYAPKYRAGTLAQRPFRATVYTNRSPHVFFVSTENTNAIPPSLTHINKKAPPTR